MDRRFLLLAALSVLVANPSLTVAQVALPGAAPTASAAPAPEPAPLHKKPSKKAAAAAKMAKPSAPGTEAIDGKPLLLNGQAGLLTISGNGDTLHIETLRLPGEGVSDPSQHCVVDIVGEKPIEARSAGRPDGLERYEADVPACPFTFDVVDGTVLIPAQITACVFKAADCKTSPGGLWGPDGSALDSTAIAKERSQAEKAMAQAVEKLQAMTANSDAAALARDQNGFAGARDEACHDYAKEATLGFCAANLTVARAALLEARLASFAHSEQAAETTDSKSKNVSAKRRVKKTKPAPADDVTQPPAQ